MTMLSIFSPSRETAVNRLPDSIVQGDGVLFRFAVVLLSLGVPIFVLMTGETRIFNGVNVWMKPLKFQLSLAIYVATLALFASFMDAGWRGSRLYRWIVAAFVTVTIFNVSYITFRASRGEASHFNQETPIADALYGLMGIGALVQVMLAALIGIAVLRSEEQRIASALRLSIGVGLIAAALLTLVFGGYMSVSGSHWVGGAQNDADGVPFFGWSRTGGDLRVAHFLGTHAMHFLPLVGLVAARISETRGKAMVWGALVFWIALSLAIFAQALAGLPLFPR